MDALLFQNEPILWIGSWIPSLALILLVVSAVFFVIFLGKRYKNRPQPPPAPGIYQKIDPNDPRYEEKTLRSLKEYLLDQYIPRHVTAHTVDEIGQYITHTELSEILMRLETALYSGERLSPSDAGEINTLIENILHPSGISTSSALSSSSLSSGSGEYSSARKSAI